MSTSPGIRNLPRASMCRAPGGTGVPADGPTTVNLGPSMTTVAPPRGAPPVPSISVAPVMARAGGELVAVTTCPRRSCASAGRSLDDDAADGGQPLGDQVPALAGVEGTEDPAILGAGHDDTAGRGQTPRVDVVVEPGGQSR